MWKAGIFLIISSVYLWFFAQLIATGDAVSMQAPSAQLKIPTALQAAAAGGGGKKSKQTTTPQVPSASTSSMSSRVEEGSEDAAAVKGLPADIYDADRQALEEVVMPLLVGRDPRDYTSISDTLAGL